MVTITAIQSFLSLTFDLVFTNSSLSSFINYLKKIEIKYVDLLVQICDQLQFKFWIPFDWVSVILITLYQICGDHSVEVDPEVFGDMNLSDKRSALLSQLQQPPPIFRRKVGCFVQNDSDTDTSSVLKLVEESFKELEFLYQPQIDYVEFAIHISFTSAETGSYISLPNTATSVRVLESRAYLKLFIIVAQSEVYLRDIPEGTRAIVVTRNLNGNLTVSPEYALRQVRNSIPRLLEV